MGVPKMIQNLAPKAFTLKLLFLANVQRQRTTTNTRITGQRQRPGLKSRTFDNFGVRPLFIFSSFNYTVLSSPWCRRVPFWGVPKMVQNLASKAFTLKLLFDGRPGQPTAAKNHKKHKDKGVDGQRPGLKSRTFDNFGVRPLFIFSALNYTILSSPWCRRALF